MERVLTHLALSYELGSVMPYPDVMEISAEMFDSKNPWAEEIQWAELRTVFYASWLWRMCYSVFTIGGI